MGRRLTDRLANAHPLGLATVLALRRFGRARVVEYLGTAWYQRKARLFAEEIGRLRGVEAVYVAGSSLDRVALGYSDIDPMIFTNLSTLTDELRFRRDLVPIVQRHNRPLELIQHLDYIDVRDVDLLQRYGDAFLIRQTNWKLLAGSDPRDMDVGPTERHRELAAVVENVRHWTTHSNRFIRPSPRADEFSQIRNNRRRLQGFIASWLGLDRSLPLSQLLEAARTRAPGEAILHLARESPGIGLASHASAQP